ncbi:MAG: hypothetical protein HY458_00875 [Parcubacteria group bacterium]|nr:hypothetical protein [Parcubacteria group bacterium]
MTNKLKKIMRKYRVGHIIMPFLLSGLVTYLLKGLFDLTALFGQGGSYVYYYSFSTIVQGFVALVAFLGMLAVFKLQRDQTKRDRMSVPIGVIAEDITKIEASMRELTIDLKTFAVVCLSNVALALIAIPFIPYFNSHLAGPAYLAGNIILSLWVLFLAFPIIEKVLRLTP